jgi:nicotinamide riboside transporter PnuC
MMLDTIAQIGIAVFGISAIILVAKKSKWGFVLGLLSQPFFFITTVINKQWGLFFLSVIYTLSWAYGIYEWFLKGKKKKR